MTVVLIGVVGLIVWLLYRNSRSGLRKAIAERDRILQQLQDVERRRQELIDDAQSRGVMISVDSALSQVEALRQSYLESGRTEDARAVERVIQEFREQNGSEVSVGKAYALMKELESKSRNGVSGA